MEKIVNENTIANFVKHKSWTYRMKNIIYAMKDMKANYVSSTKGTILLLLMIVCISMTSCIVSHDARTTRIEIMKPAIFKISENIKTVALINGSSNNPFIPTFNYINHLVILTNNSDYQESTAS